MTESSKILASGFAPLSVGARRLEVRLEEAVLSRVPPNASIESSSKPQPRRSPRQPSSLVYWASEANEVDEPAGAWMLGRGGILQRLVKLSALADENAKVVSFSANSSGSACLLITDKTLLFVSENESKTVEQRSSSSTRPQTWCRCGRPNILDRSGWFRELGDTWFSERGVRAAYVVDCGGLPITGRRTWGQSQTDPPRSTSAVERSATSSWHRNYKHANSQKQPNQMTAQGRKIGTSFF